MKAIPGTKRNNGFSANDKNWTIIKYRNRKLYCFNINMYVNLSEIDEHIKNGGSVTFKNGTKPNIERDTLLAILFQKEICRDNKLLGNIIKKGGLVEYALQLEGKGRIQ